MLHNGNRSVSSDLAELRSKLAQAGIKLAEVEAIAGKPISISKIKKYFRGEVQPEAEKRRIQIACQVLLRRATPINPPQDPGNIKKKNHPGRSSNRSMDEAGSSPKLATRLE